MTVKERLHHLIDGFTPAKAEAVARMLEALEDFTKPDARSANRDDAERPRATGLRITPANPDPARWREPLPDLPGVDLSGAVLEEREEALRRW